MNCMILLLLLPLLCGATEQIEFRVQENVPPRTLVGTLRRAGAVMFSHTTDIQDFSVDPKYGDIRVVHSPDRETKEQYEMVVIIMMEPQTGPDSSGPRSPLAVTVRIVITDVNDNAPQFPRKIIPMTITEAQPVGFKIPLDPAEDADLGNNSTKHYRILNENVPFQLEQIKLGFDDQYSCNLQLVSPLDRETRDYYLLQVEAQDGGQPYKSDLMTLQITIADVNDNTPQFNQTIYSPSISEDAPIGSVVCAVLATDSDQGQNSKISYLIEPRFNKEELFQMDPDSGLIVLAGLLDREVAATHDLVIRATDNGEFPERTTVRVSITVLDVNDNYPGIKVTFLSQDDTVGLVSENSKIGTYVAHVSVTDLDTGENGRVELQLAEEAAPFALERVETGYVLHVSGPLDRELRDTWHVSLLARDHGKPAKEVFTNITISVVDVNDCVPEFTQQVYRRETSEVSAKGKDIVQVTAVDNDTGVNARITYHIVGITSIGATSDDVNNLISFSINSESGIITTGSMLDREAMEAIRLTIEARDGGTPSLKSRCTVIVEISDYNDNDPKFSQRHYTALLPEGALVGSPVITVSAVDADNGGTAPITYFIKEYYSAARTVFTINSTSGEIVTAARLDYETQKSYNMVVEARDEGGRRGVTSVEVHVRDLNDNSPQFSQATYRASLLHTVLPGTIVTRVSAFDVDSGMNGVVTYSVLQGGSMFNIDPQTGIITTTVSLHGMTNVTERLIVQAVDGGTQQQSSVCNVQVLIGSLSTIDLKPIFNTQEYDVDVPETLSRGDVIVTVFARSPDPDYSGSIKYTISKLTRQVHDLFFIEEDSGRIKTRNTLDREQQDFYNFIIEATDDLGRQGMTSVRVTVTDVDDNKAVFPASNYHFSVYENLDKGAVVARITATDIDYGVNGAVQYIITSANNNLPFEIDTYSGELTVTGDLDYETQMGYNLKIKAFNKANSGFFQETDVSISVLDVNDNAPLFIRSEFHFRLLDSSLEDATVGVAMATDKDSGVMGDVYYTLHPTEFSNLFQIDLRTGEVRTAVTFATKRDLEETYTLKVLCRDRGFPSLNATVEVTIEMMSSGEVVTMLEKVLSNEAISRKAKYLIIFFASAFIFTAIILVCFIRYHKKRTSQYKRAASNSMIKPPLPGRKSSDTLLTLGRADLGLSSDTLLSKNPPRSVCSNNYNKFVECGSYCPSVPEHGAAPSQQDIISTSYFHPDLVPRTASRASKESLAASLPPPHASLPPPPPPPQSYYKSGYIPETLLPPEDKVPDLGSSYDLSPSCINRQCHETRCPSNESGVASGQGSTPPASEINFLKKDPEVLARKESWVSSMSDESLFKNPLSSLHSIAKSNPRVRFQKLHDSFV